MLEHGQELLGTLGEGEAGLRDDAGGVIYEGDQVGFAPPALVVAVAADGRAVHDIAHPQFPGVTVGEAAPVLGRRLVAEPVHQPLLPQQAVDGRGGESHLFGDAAARVRLPDDFADGQAGGLLLEADQLLRGLCRQAPRLAAVTAGPGTESCKAAVTVLAEPAADCFGGDTGAPGAGDQVDLRGLLGDPGCDVGSWL